MAPVTRGRAAHALIHLLREELNLAGAHIGCETRIRRFYSLDDCGTRINPMIIEGQIPGVTHREMPDTAFHVWKPLQASGIATSPTH